MEDASNTEIAEETYSKPEARSVTVAACSVPCRFMHVIGTRKNTLQRITWSLYYVMSDYKGPDSFPGQPVWNFSAS